MGVRGQTLIGDVLRRARAALDAVWQLDRRRWLARSHRLAGPAVHAPSRNLNDTRCAFPLLDGEELTMIGADVTCPYCLQQLLDIARRGDPWPMLDQPPR